MARYLTPRTKQYMGITQTSLRSYTKADPPVTPLVEKLIALMNTDPQSFSYHFESMTDILDEMDREISSSGLTSTQRDEFEKIVKDLRKLMDDMRDKFQKARSSATSNLRDRQDLFDNRNDLGSFIEKFFLRLT